jgi:hypothetical protein
MNRIDDSPEMIRLRVIIASERSYRNGQRVLIGPSVSQPGHAYQSAVCTNGMGSPRKDEPMVTGIAPVVCVLVYLVKATRM